MPRLRHADCSAEGIRRRRRGRGFEYIDVDGSAVTDAETLERLRGLSIPPAWEEVWICPDPLGHLQATGIDDAGRKQYLYHEDWRRRRDAEKFDSMLEFARTLPRLRQRVSRDIRLEGVPRERVLACAVRLLDRGFFRIGGEDYAEQHDSYGIATIQRDHVAVTDGQIRFDYPAKNGRRRIQTITDGDATTVIARLKRRRAGPSDLLAYREGRRWRDLRSDDVNAYIKDIAGEAFSAKDFRTWSGTVLAAAALSAAGEPETNAARKRAINDAVRRVAEYLGNTPAVSRSSYIDPRVFDRYLSGATIDAPVDLEGGLSERARRRIEKAVIDLLS